MAVKAVTIVRYLLGAQYVVSGLNWWVKLLPFPSIGDPPAAAYKHEILGAMIHSGWMFGASKAIELTAGLALLLNLFVPLMLVVSFPIALATFILDALVFSTVAAWLAGAATTDVLLDKLWDAYFLGGMLFAMQVYLMFAYIQHYRPMLAMRGRAEAAPKGALAAGAMQALAVFAVVSGLLALAIIGWMMVQWLGR
jgi:hypothetical protein